MLLFETTRLSIFKKISSLPVFAPTQMKIFSTLPDVIRAYLLKFQRKSPAYPCIRDPRVQVRPPWFMLCSVTNDGCSHPEVTFLEAGSRIDFSANSPSL